MDGVLADEVLEQESRIPVIQLGGANPLVEIGVRFQVILLVGGVLIDELEILLCRPILPFLEKFGCHFVLIVRRIIRHRPLSERKSYAP